MEFSFVPSFCVNLGVFKHSIQNHSICQLIRVKNDGYPGLYILKSIKRSVAKKFLNVSFQLPDCNL